MDIHALIQEFLQQRSVVSLLGDAGQPTDHYIKAGVVPFVREPGAISYYFMKPVGRQPGLGAPSFQFCKGTRMYRSGGGWVDMREGDQAEHKETLAATALREGIEELGLKLDAITELIELGPYRFSSAKSGKEKFMWLFAAEMDSMENVLPAHEVASTTADRGWLSLGEFERTGREDHRTILRDIEDKLKKYYNEPYPAINAG